VRGERDNTRMVQLSATAAIEYVAAGHFSPGVFWPGDFWPGDFCPGCFCPGGLLSEGTFVQGAYARSPEVQCVYIQLYSSNDSTN